jgi:ABC-type tungstate transport system substrate-binding protein
MFTGIVSLVFYIACIAGAASIGSRKGRPVLGIVLGIVLLLVGVIIIAVIPAKRSSYY